MYTFLVFNMWDKLNTIQIKSYSTEIQLALEL